MFGEAKLCEEFQGEASPKLEETVARKPMRGGERPLKCSLWAAAWAKSKHCTGLPLC